MEETNRLRYNFDSFDLIVFIKKKFKILLILTFIGAIVSAIVSLLITEKFKSTVVLFPTPSTSVAKALLTDNVSSKTISVFGEEEEVEQLLQVLNSDEIREFIKNKYNLQEHYNIKTDDKYKQTTFTKKYYGNISCRRTRFMSVEIEVLDKDRNYAANIANDIAAQLDSVMNRMQKSRALKAFKIVEKEYLSLSNQIDIMRDSLTWIREKGVVDYESQAEVFNRAYAEALSSGNIKGAEKLEEKLEIVKKYGGAYVAIRDFLEEEIKQLSILKSRYAEAKVNANANLPHKFIVNKAYPADKKSYPVRWLIVLLSTIGTAFISILILIVIDIFKTR